MSGSGGFSSGSSITTPCNNLKFQTNIASPKTTALSLSIGDVLDITVQGDALKLLHNGTIVGGIACKESSRLLYCIEQGNNYEAEVIKVNLAKITVSVYPL